MLVLQLRIVAERSSLPAAVAEREWVMVTELEVYEVVSVVEP